MTLSITDTPHALFQRELILARVWRLIEQDFNRSVAARIREARKRDADSANQRHTTERLKQERAVA